jgi:hypothetical protein
MESDFELTQGRVELRALVLVVLNVGRPRHTRKDGIIKMGQENGKSYKEMRVLAKDRGKWGDWTEDPTP